MIAKLSPTTDARIRQQQLLSQVMRPATLSLLEKARDREGGNALCLDCGEGEVVFHLAGLIGHNENVTGIDPSRENIQTARQLAVIKKIGNADFYENDKFQCPTEGYFGLVYGCLQLTRPFDPDALIRKTCNFLRMGGIALFEVIDFSTFFSTPKNFAFERFIEVCAALIDHHWGDLACRDQMAQSLACSGFHPVEQQYVAPAFLRGKSRNLPSLTLASIQDEVIRQKLATQDELQVLLYELKDFEQKPDSLISLPGIHQIWGKKTRPIF